MSERLLRRGHLVATAPVEARAFDRHGGLADLPCNFTPITYEQAEADPSWRVDHRGLRIAREAPGPPRPQGPFALAQQFLADYRMADPVSIRAVYDPRGPLQGRNLLLVGRFAGLRFHMGVRIGGVEQGEAHLDGRPVHRFAWHYRTLEGHLERGQMDYELVKDLESGVVDFRLRAYSQQADIADPVVRLGFVLFGRSVQRRFYRRSLARMRELVVEHEDEPDGP